MVRQEIVRKVRVDTPANAFEEVNFVPLLGQAPQEEQWNMIVQNVINVVKFFMFGLEENTKR